MTLVDIVKERMEDMASIAGLLTGGIYDRPLLKASPNVFGATPNAFAAGQHGQVRPSAVIRNEPRTPAPGLPGLFADIHIISVWLYVPATNDGKVILADVSRELRFALNGYTYPAEDGHRGILTWIGQTGYRDDPVNLGTLVDTVRFAATVLVQIPA